MVPLPTSAAAPGCPHLEAASPTCAAERCVTPPRLATFRREVGAAVPSRSVSTGALSVKRAFDLPRKTPGGTSSCCCIQRSSDSSDSAKPGLNSAKNA